MLMKGLSSSPPGASPSLGLDTLRVNPEISRCYSLTRPVCHPPGCAHANPKAYMYICVVFQHVSVRCLLSPEFNVVILMDFYQRETSHFTLLVSC